MTNGTTPTIKWNMAPLEASMINVAYFTIQCTNGRKIERDLTTATAEGVYLIWELSQAETLLLTPTVDLQIRYKIGGKAYSSDIFTVDVERILKKGEI